MAGTRESIQNQRRPPIRIDAPRLFRQHPTANENEPASPEAHISHGFRRSVRQGSFCPGGSDRRRGGDYHRGGREAEGLPAMNPRARWLVALAAAVVLAGGAWAVREIRARRAWAAGRPPVPDVSTWPGVFQAQLRADDARAARWPPDTAALGDLAALYMANGFSAQAETCLRTLCGRDPAQARWPHLLGSLLASYGRLEEALPFFQAAVARDPGDIPARLRMGAILLKTNRSEASAAAYREVLKISPTDPYALLGLARVDLEQGRWSAARLELEAAVRAHPDFPAAFNQLAKIYERSGNLEQAEESRQRGEALGRYRDLADPWVDDLWQVCYDVYRLQVIAATRTATGQLRAARPVLERALGLAPADANLERQLGNLWRDLGELAPAREHLEKAVGLQPKEAGTYLDLIGVYKTQLDATARSRILDQALRECPNDAGLHFERGLERVTAGQLDEAVSSFQTTIRLSPERAPAYYQLALVLFRLGRSDEAVASLESALAHEPDYGPGLQALIHYRITRREAAAAAALLAQAQRAGLNGTAFIELARDYERVFGQPPPDPRSPAR